MSSKHPSLKILYVCATQQKTPPCQHSDVHQSTLQTTEYLKEKEN